MKRRVIICLGLLLALCLLGDGIAMLCLNRSIRHLFALAESHEIQSMRSELSLSGSRIETDFLAAQSRFRHDTERRYDSVRLYEDSLNRCDSCHHATEIQAELNGLRETFLAYREVMEEIDRTTEPRTEVELERIAHGIADQVVEQTMAMTQRARHGLQEKNAAATRGVSNAWIALSITLFVALIFGGIIAVHLMKSVTRPVEELLDGIEQVRQGNHYYRFAIAADREFTDLGVAFNQAYASLKAAQDNILQAEKMAAVGKLAAGFAHEVGNPLASISSLAQMMRRESVNGEQQERIDLIMKEVQRTSGIVRDLLTFTRPTNDQACEIVQIGDLLDHAVKLLRYDKRTQRIEIRVERDAEVPPVLGRSDRLIQVFTNIMINAVDAIGSHNKDGVGTLEIRTRFEGDRVAVLFTDDGPGMTPEHIHSAFDPFFTTKEPGKGTGLGLWICYQEIQRHKGTIRIESEVGGGTTVRIDLPARRGAAV